VAGLVICLRLLRIPPGNRPDYASRVFLFTPEERSFLGVLEQALDSRYRVFGKVRVGDLIQPSQGLDAGQRSAALDRINRSHVDFVVCTANELALIGVLELGDSSRDASIDLSLAEAGIPLLRFPVKKEYSLQDVRARLAETMLSDKKTGALHRSGKSSASTHPVLDAIMGSRPVQPDTDSPSCPKCSATMVKRESLVGDNAGRAFWACSTFPRCGQVEEIGAG
jgi:hypothetical protein